MKGGGGGRLVLTYKRERMLVKHFEKTPQRYQVPVLWTWLEIIFNLSICFDGCFTTLTRQNNSRAAWK